ncbi:kelch domain-containing protein 4 [Harpegnathos saltator]|uniref:Kelch domain-containing protein 4 n=1 Tax=Harpegnathos saltator TaxID=610380 RepID=E2C151_HARSA|nr:kelch domain-containing protein 4 [Harpegnathos saltator]EFN78372.1 Kelch domain-containing protein 4 [Harpegnathos saltator]
MGKKDKNKKKMSGSEKTALKTEKKLNARQKKELAALGEDDIEKVVAEIEQEEARRQRVKEVIVEPPSRRVNFTLNAHPYKDELIMLGGEFYDGRQTIVYGDMFFYNINKKEWSVVKAPGAPPPRCGHQAVITAARGGELWVFGGEFSSPSESQFYHYRDLWVFLLSDKKWEKIIAPNGPSARSGHRMVLLKKQLIVFGGFHDNLRDYKYFNDVYAFDLETYVWRKIEPAGLAPTPRSGCVVLPTPGNKIMVYGGYNKERIKKDVDKGRIHDDMFLLTPDKNDTTKYKWTCVRQTGMRATPRCGISAALDQPNLALLFGGVQDEEEEDDEENLRGTFYKDLLALDLEKFQWHSVTLSGKKENATTERRRRRKQKDGGDEERENQQSDDSEDAEMSQESPTNPTQSNTITVEDGVFTMTLGTAPVKAVSGMDDLSVDENSREVAAFSPSARMNTGMVVKNNILYLYGGLVEDCDRQYTLNDFYSLDCRKLQQWKTLIPENLKSHTWFDSSSSSEEDDSEDSNEDD